jgi:signal peptidase II
MSTTDGNTAAQTFTLPVAQSGLPWLVLSLVGVIADQATKAAVVARFELHETLTLLPVLDFIHTRNTGAAFSFLATAGGWQRWLFAALALVISAVICVWLRRTVAALQPLLVAGLALVLSGAVGNVIDRLRLGYVVDFVAVHWNEHYFPAFNVADSCITVGAGLLILDALLSGRAKVTGGL